MTTILYIDGEEIFDDAEDTYDEAIMEYEGYGVCLTSVEAKELKEEIFQSYVNVEVRDAGLVNGKVIVVDETFKVRDGVVAF